jgi:proteasome lid subunit RPN8/RPN11
MLFLSSKLEAEIRVAGETAYPDECCGILIGGINSEGSKIVKRTEAVNNAREESEKFHRFLITPENVFHAEQTARAAKLELIGFYHSHPDHPASPSEYDRDNALPFYSYAIISVEKGKAKELTSWELSADRTIFKPEKIKSFFDSTEDA